ncbi:MAG: TolC family protein [Rhodocyclaceae bacterium]
MKASLLATFIAALLAGCASTAIDDNRSATSDFARDKLSVTPRWLDSAEAQREARAETDALLQQPLTLEAAQSIALRYSPAFQALQADAATSSARITQSARISNPLFTFEKLVRLEDGVRDLDIGRMLTVSLFELITLPARLRIADSQQQRLRMVSAGNALQTVTDVRQAWLRAVAANEAQGYHQQVMDLADAAAELAQRMQAAGNFSRLQRMRQQGFYAEAAAELVRARGAANDARESLVRLLGLDAAQAAQLKLPARLPDLPGTPRDEAALSQTALDERLDLRLARFDLEATAREQGLTRVESVVNGLHVSGVRNSATGKTTQRGYELEFPLPVFDTGDARRAGAQATYLAAFHRAAQAGVDASSQVRQHYQRYRDAYDLARHYRDEILPLRKLASEEMQLKYNGMLIGVFDLLADARGQVTSVIATLNAQRDFWLADAALQATLLGKPASITTDMPQAASTAGADSGGH